MSAIVCGKRSNFFEDLQSSSPSSPPVSKRIRCSSSSPVRNLSPPRSTASNYSAYNFYSSSSALDHLICLFPEMDKQILERALEESGDDLDSAIKSLNELCLTVAGSKSDVAQDGVFTAEGPLTSNGETSPEEEASVGRNLPVNGSEWVELFVREMMSASNIEDAKIRASHALEVLEKSISARASEEASQSFQQENLMLKQQLEVLIQENAILKRAVSIQHERQKEFEERGQELHQLKQLVSQYQEQLRTLEVNNYALAMHLKQAQQSNSIPGGSFNPDVF